MSGVDLNSMFRPPATRSSGWSWANVEPSMPLTAEALRECMIRMEEREAEQRRLDAEHRRKQAEWFASLPEFMQRNFIRVLASLPRGVVMHPKQYAEVQAEIKRIREAGPE